MFTTLKIAAFTGVFLTGLFGPDRIGLAGAQQQTGPEHSARGGILATADGLRFEILFFPTGARVFPLDGSGKPRQHLAARRRCHVLSPQCPGRGHGSRGHSIPSRRPPASHPRRST